MSDLQFIEQTLQQAARRRRAERAFRGLCMGMLVGACLFLVTLGTYKLFPIPYAALGISGAVALACLPAGLLIGGWRRNTLTETARWVDGRTHLQERLSTALEMAGSKAPQNWRELLVTDAASHAKGLDARKLVAFGLPRTTRWALLTLALAAGLGFVPEFRSKNYLQKQTEQKIIQDAGKHLVELTKQNKPAVMAMESTEKSMQAVNDLGDQFTKKAITRTEALKNLDSLADKIKDQMKDLQKDPALKRMEQAARARNNDTSPDPQQLQKQIADAQKQMGNSKASSEQMDKMSKELSKLQEQAKNASEKDGGMSQADKEKLTQSMAALSKQMQDAGMKAPNLDQAIEALASNQTDMVLKDLDAATTDLEKMKQMSKDLQQMQAQMEKIGKDLAEQLKNGQAQAAQQTLQKMMDQLKQSSLSKEDLQKMMDEVAKAADPGSKFGKVGDLLKQAAGQMGQGQKGEAGKSLADASKELDKLMQQMGDAQALMAELDALDKASMCIGTCNGWGSKPCNKPGFNPNGSKPGSGVGTWADENGGWGYDGAQTQKWDNTGMTRPDMDSKGQTDRGDGELSDALKPTKVKGQFSPGGNMPSVTLKGVSIPGTSNVKMEQEAVVAAQQEAQSALSQEKVPRAYQGSVRTYFDDSKK